MNTYDIFDYIVQSRVSMENMPDDLLQRAYLSLKAERRRRKKRTF